MYIALVTLCTQVNFEKLANLAGLKNAASAATSYNGAKKKFLSSGSTNIASLAGGVTMSSASSSPASKKRKVSGKANTSKPSNGRSATHVVNNHEDNELEDDDEEDIAPEVMAAIFAKEEAEAESAAAQLKPEQDEPVLTMTKVVTKPNGTSVKLEAEAGGGRASVENAIIIKAEDEEQKAKELLRKAFEISKKASHSASANGVETKTAATGATFGEAIDMSNDAHDGDSVNEV